MSRRAKRAQRAETDAPLKVTIDQLTPSTIPARGVIRISGTVTNTDTVPWSTINVRPFISAEPMTTPAELEKAAATPADEVVGERINDEQHKGFIEELAPGEFKTYSFKVPRRLLDADAPGVYWFGVHALGEGPDGRDETADGRARTFLPLVPEAREGQEPTAVVIPLRRQLVYADDGSVDDLAGWTKTLSPGGRLRSLVDFGASSGDLSVTWVVDPALVDAVRRLAAGNPPRSLEPNLQAGQDDGEDEPDPVRLVLRFRQRGAERVPVADRRGRARAPENPLDLDELDPAVQAAARGRPGLAGPARRGDAQRGRGADPAVRRRRRGRRGRARPAAPAARGGARRERGPRRLRRQHEARRGLPQRLPQRPGAAAGPGGLGGPAHGLDVRAPGAAGRHHRGPAGGGHLHGSR